VLDVIQSFGSANTERLFRRERVKQFEPFERRAQRKLAELDAATSLNDLRAIPGNRLEKLKGDRKAQHSIRINDQWRVCFLWKDGNAHDVEITDYHD
jgi:proteic killer suppression protein